MFQLYQRFDVDKNGVLDSRECICLADALFRSVFFADAPPAPAPMAFAPGASPGCFGPAWPPGVPPGVPPGMPPGVPPGVPAGVPPGVPSGMPLPPPVHFMMGLSCDDGVSATSPITADASSAPHRPQRGSTPNRSQVDTKSTHSDHPESPTFDPAWSVSIWAHGQRCV